MYTIPPSKIGPKAIQNSHLPVLGGSSPNTFLSMARYADGWIGVVRNNLEQPQDSLNMLKQKVNEADRKPEDFEIIVIEIIVITYPNIVERDTRKEKHLAFTGSIGQVGIDIERLK